MPMKSRRPKKHTEEIRLEVMKYTSTVELERTSTKETLLETVSCLVTLLIVNRPVE